MRILLLEDQPSLSEAIAAHLQLKGYSVDTAASIRDARLALDAGVFDAALFDLSLPDGDGVDLIGKLRRSGSLLPILIMTARDRISDRIRGLEAGADDYLVKPFDLNEMIARLQAVARRYAGNPAPTVRLGQLEIDRSGHRVFVAGADAGLTAKEWAVFEKLSGKPGAILSKRQLEEALYSFDDQIESNTVEVYVSRLRKKLGKDTIETARGLGYRFISGSKP
jgi:two-component system OmpR family response regulator